MKLSTENIVKLLPFEESFKKEFFEQYPSLDADRKFTIQQLVWEAYYAFYRLELEKNFQLGLDDLKTGKEKPDAQFYKRIKEKTQTEMRSDAVEEVEEVDLTEARAAMEKIIAEMRAAKMSPK